MRSREAVSRAADVAWARWEAGIEAREPKAIDAMNRLMIAIAEAPRPDDLPPRLVQVLQLVADGYTSREIAEKLGIAEETVKTHKQKILLRLDARNRTHAVYLGLQRGIIH